MVLKLTCLLFAVVLGDFAACSGTFVSGSERSGSGTPLAQGKGSLNPKHPLEHLLSSLDSLRY